MADEYAYSTPDEQRAANDLSNFLGGSAASADASTGDPFALPGSSTGGATGDPFAMPTSTTSGGGDASSGGPFDALADATRQKNLENDPNLDKDGKPKNGKGGKNKGVVFGNTLNYDKTYVYSIMPDKEHGVFYKVQVIPIDENEEGKIGNDHMHESTLDAMVTAVNIQRGVRQQINYTLGNTAYLYVFGESVTELIIGGFGFWKCDTGDEQFDSASKILDFYKYNNVSREGKYCKVLLGDKVFKGYLINSDIGFTERELGLVSFKFTFIGVFQE